MTVQTRYIEKFGKEVTIDSDHPLAKLQDQLDAEEQKGGEEKVEKKSKSKSKDKAAE